MPTFGPTIGHSRPAAGVLAAGWADKTDEILVKKPVYLRGWFLRLMLVVLLLAVAGGVVGGLSVLHWHRQIQADLASHRRGVEVFVRSEKFEAFARETDAQLVAMFNFAVLRPREASGLLPEIAAAEKTRGLMPWPLELMPLSVSAANHPARVRAELCIATNLLANRGFVFDSQRTTEARRVLLRLLARHARAFAAEDARLSLPALAIDRRMQDIVLAAYAARAGGTAEDIEKSLVLFSLVGPALWQELEAISSRRFSGSSSSAQTSATPR